MKTTYRPEGESSAPVPSLSPDKNQSLPYGASNDIELHDTEASKSYV